MQTMFARILNQHILLWPYQSKILNLTDTLLLINMNILQAIMQSQAVDATWAVDIVHLIYNIIATLACLAAWFTCVCLYMCNICNRLPASCIYWWSGHNGLQTQGDTMCRYLILRMIEKSQTFQCKFQGVKGSSYCNSQQSMNTNHYIIHSTLILFNTCTVINAYFVRVHVKKFKRFLKEIYQM